jgi:DeoR family transcriptional regulator of aga operon
VFIGGSVNYEEMATFGTMAEAMLQSLNIDKLFIGCRGIDLRAGLSNDLQVEDMIGTERAFVAASRQVIALADHTKFGQVFPLQSVPITAVDVIVTDSLTPEDVLREFCKQDTQVVVAPLSENNGRVTSDEGRVTRTF